MSTPLCVVAETRFSCKTSPSAICSRPAIAALGPLEFTSPIGRVRSLRSNFGILFVSIGLRRIKQRQQSKARIKSVERVSIRQVQEAFYQARTTSIRKDARPSTRRIRRADPPIEVRQYYAGGNHVFEIHRLGYVTPQIRRRQRGDSPFQFISLNRIRSTWHHGSKIDTRILLTGDAAALGYSV